MVPCVRSINVRACMLSADHHVAVEYSTKRRATCLKRMEAGYRSAGGSEIARSAPEARACIRAVCGRSSYQTLLYTLTSGCATACS